MVEKSAPTTLTVRLDKWLWAARFFKTRSLAAQAVEGGRVRINGERTKPARLLRMGDQLRIHIAELEWQVEVLQLSTQRGPAPVARTLYAETEASLAVRAEALAARQWARDPSAERHGRPSKKDRRLIHRFQGGDDV